MIENSSYAVWLYGSHSRGNSDEYSDVDVLVVTDSSEREIVLDLSKFQNFPTVSRYSWKEVESMAEYGSLFLRHVELEGRPIYESANARGRMRNILTSLGDYRLANRDLRGFRVVLSDITESLHNEGASLIFEAATLGTLVRHASILGCNLSGNPCFSRLKPVSQLTELWHMPKSWANEFPSLYEYRLYADGRVQSLDKPTEDFAWTWCQRAGMLLDKLQRRIDG